MKPAFPSTFEEHFQLSIVNSAHFDTSQPTIAREAIRFRIQLVQSALKAPIVDNGRENRNSNNLKTASMQIALV